MWLFLKVILTSDTSNITTKWLLQGCPFFDILCNKLSEWTGAYSGGWKGYGERAWHRKVIETFHNIEVYVIPSSAQQINFVFEASEVLFTIGLLFQFLKSFPLFRCHLLSSFWVTNGDTLNDPAFSCSVEPFSWSRPNMLYLSVWWFIFKWELYSGPVCSDLSVFNFHVHLGNFRNS
jgi:hypothetical protein